MFTLMRHVKAIPPDSAPKIHFGGAMLPERSHRVYRINMTKEDKKWCMHVTRDTFLKKSCNCPQRPHESRAA